jgi:hypothetical protein
MPPQQGNGLLDVFDGAFGFGAHVQSSRNRRYGGSPASCKDGPEPAGPFSPASDLARE